VSKFTYNLHKTTTTKYIFNSCEQAVKQNTQKCSNDMSFRFVICTQHKQWTCLQCWLGQCY